MMSMTELEHQKNLLAISRPVPFSYDREARQFSFGSETRQADELSLYGHAHTVDTGELSPDEVDELIAREPVIHTARHPIMLPKYHRFIRDNWSPELEEEVVDVMAEVMTPVVPEILQDRKPSVFSFGAMRIDAEMGRVILQVPGICACLGPDAVVPMWGSHNIAAGTFHNIDMPWQRAALLAGLGHLALRAQ